VNVSVWPFATQRQVHLINQERLLQAYSPQIPRLHHTHGATGFGLQVMATMGRPEGNGSITIQVHDLQHMLLITGGWERGNRVHSRLQKCTSSRFKTNERGC
jgi:hypothetical protein